MLNNFEAWKHRFGSSRTLLLFVNQWRRGSKMAPQMAKCKRRRKLAVLLGITTRQPVIPIPHLAGSPWKLITLEAHSHAHAWGRMRAWTGCHPNVWCKLLFISYSMIILLTWIIGCWANVILRFRFIFQIKFFFVTEYLGVYCPAFRQENVASMISSRGPTRCFYLCGTKQLRKNLWVPWTLMSKGGVHSSVAPLSTSETTQIRSSPSQFSCLTIIKFHRFCEIFMHVCAVCYCY